MNDLTSQEPVIIGGVVSIVTAFLTPVLAKRGIDATGVAAIGNGMAAIGTAVVSGVALVITRKKVVPVAVIAAQADAVVPQPLDQATPQQ